MIRVYFASKLHHAEKWRALCRSTPDIQCHARWLKHVAMGTPDRPEDAPDFWQQDEQDVRDADAVIVYAEGDDQLRGALVEAGMAIAYGVPVIVIGEHPFYGTWQYHPSVVRARDLEWALDYVRHELTPRYRRMRA
jgi:nucleoside 2-deoxyribosyltransferase